MEEKKQAPAVKQGAEKLSKDTNIMKDTQLMNSCLSELDTHLKTKESELKARRKEQQNGKSYQKVLKELLSQLKEVNYREIAGIGTNEKVPVKKYIVITIENIIDTAISYNWGLTTKHGFIYVFNGAYWQPIEADDFKYFLGKAAIKMGVPELEAKHHLFKDELFKQFMSSSCFLTPESDNQQTLINLQNGTFEISDTCRLREARREDFIKYQLPFAYNPDAQCPLFYKYLNRVVPDIDCQMVLAEFLGYVFTKNLKLEKAVILYGGGANGKSVFFEIVNAILGEQNISSYSLQNLTKPESYQRAELSNKLLNYCPEINSKLEASLAKQLISNEPVEARQIYGKPFNMRDYAKLMFNCNELPKDVEHTNAYYRRFIIIPFLVTIPEDEQDPELAKKIIESELSGVFNWILEGLKPILKNKRFTQSKLITEQLQNYRKESDSVAMFLDEEKYEQTKGYPNILLKTMFNDYRVFCLDNGYKSCSIKTLSNRLKTLGFTMERGRDGAVVFARK